MDLRDGFEGIKWGCEMKSFLFGLTAIVFLSGCAGFDHYRYNAGYKKGKKLSKYGYDAKSPYYRGIYEGFLLQNFKNRND